MSPAKMDRIESGIRAVAELNQAFNRHDVQGILLLVTESCVMEDPPHQPKEKTLNGREQIAEHYTKLFCTYPDIRIETEELIGLGHRCVLRWKMSFRVNQGEACSLRGADIFKVQNGLICESFSYLKLLQNCLR